MTEIVKIPVYMLNEEAKQFLEFQENYALICGILGYMKDMRVNNLKNSNISIDIDSNGSVGHVGITKHYRY